MPAFHGMAPLLQQQHLALERNQDSITILQADWMTPKGKSLEYKLARSAMAVSHRLSHPLPRPTGFAKLFAPRFSAAGMVRMKNHEKSGGVFLIWNPGQVLTAGCGETPGRARTFISDQSKEVSQDRERRRKLHRCIQTAIDSARRDWSSARRD